MAGRKTEELGVPSPASRKQRHEEPSTSPVGAIVQATATLRRLHTPGALTAQQDGTIATLLRRQQQFNSRMLALGVFNLMQTRHLSNEVRHVQDAIRHTRHALGEVRGAVADNAASVQRVDRELSVVQTDVCGQQEELTALTHTVAARTGQVDSVLEAYRTQIAAQQAALCQQRADIERLAGSRLKHDAVVDISLFILALVAANTPVVTWPSALAAKVLVLLPALNRHPRRWQSSLQSVFKLAALVATLHTLRTYAQRVGLHHHMGSVASYGHLAGSAVTTAATRVLPQAVLHHAASLYRRLVPPEDHDDADSTPSAYRT